MRSSPWQKNGPPAATSCRRGRMTRANERITQVAHHGENGGAAPILAVPVGPVPSPGSKNWPNGRVRRWRCAVDL